MKNEHVDFLGGPYVRDYHHPWTGNFFLKQPRLNRKTLWVLDTVPVFPLCSTASMTLKRVSKGETSCFLWQSKKRLRMKLCCIYIYMIIVELRTPATPVGVGGGKERGGCHLNLRTWHAEGRRPIVGLCWPSLGLGWPILRPWWPMPMRTKCCNLQHSTVWDGKNSCKYQSCSPRKWLRLKHSYLQSLVHITIFDFLKNA